MQKLSRSLAENLAALDALFGASADYYAKEITIYHCKGAIILFDGTPLMVTFPSAFS